MLNLVSKGSIKGTLSSSEQGGVSEFEVDEGYSYNVGDGTAAGQANAVYVHNFDIGPSANLDIDLAGSLTDVLGDALTFTAVKEIYVEADPTNANNVVVGGAATPFVGGNGAGTNVFNVKPGGLYHVCDGYSAAGWAVGAGASDLFRVGNGGAGTNVKGRVIIIGER